MLLLCIRLLHALSALLIRLVSSLFWINIDGLPISALGCVLCWPDRRAYNESRSLLILDG
jgi:hypothetical protein